MSDLWRQLDHSRAMDGRYTRIISDRPHLAGLLTGLRDNHRAHAAELATAIAAEIRDDSDAVVVAGLLREETAGAAEAVGACMSAEPRHAALFGSIAAALATHRAVLEDLP
ncbi:MULTISPECIES: hypothetical protein [Actinoplanes]|uniref:hypothetical protein n=1 Tax=Actinoplanes TaxID=1865 RepID=UPI0012FA1C39|nr:MULTISPECIES: hypothetical protein [Actinoplanes]GLY02331.1 hypothetical protein Acsp01_27100 [Actinoplanes sp. NBRC 101535]